MFQSEQKLQQADTVLEQKMEEADTALEHKLIQADADLELRLTAKIEQVAAQAQKQPGNLLTNFSQVFNAKCCFKMECVKIEWSVVSTVAHISGSLHIESKQRNDHHSLNFKMTDASSVFNECSEHLPNFITPAWLLYSTNYFG